MKTIRQDAQNNDILEKWASVNEGKIKNTEGELMTFLAFTTRLGIEKGQAMRVQQISSVEQN